MSCLGLKLFGLKNSLLCVSSRVMFLELFLQVSYTFLPIGPLEFLLIYFCVVRTRQYHSCALQGRGLLQILHSIFWLMHNSVDTLRNLLQLDVDFCLASLLYHSRSFSTQLISNWLSPVLCLCGSFALTISSTCPCWGTFCFLFPRYYFLLLSTVFFPLQQVHFLLGSCHL